MTERHPKDPGTLGWVLVQKHPSGLPKLCKAMSPSEDTLTLIFHSKAEAERYLGDYIEPEIRDDYEARPVIVYFAVGDTGEGIVNEKGQLT